MTAKNIDDESAEFTNIFDSTELSGFVEGDGVEGGSLWEDVTLDENPGEVDSGEEVSEPLIYDAEDTDEYEAFIDYGLDIRI